MDTGVKDCVRCGHTKALDEFPQEKRNKDGRGGACLACRRLDHQKWREGNREKYNAHVNRWRKANPDGAQGPDQRWVRCLDYLGNTCVYCDSSTDLQFIHTRDRIFAIEAGLALPWEMLKYELDKCDLICYNCRYA